MDRKTEKKSNRATSLRDLKKETLNPEVLIQQVPTAMETRNENSSLKLAEGEVWRKWRVGHTLS